MLLLGLFATIVNIKLLASKKRQKSSGGTLRCDADESMYELIPKHL